MVFSANEGGDRVARALMALGNVLALEYRFIFHYPRLMELVAEKQVKEWVRVLVEDSGHHADMVASLITRLGGDWVMPDIEPLPESLDLKQLFQKQLEYERLALWLHSQAAELLTGEDAATAWEIAESERWHIALVERIIELYP